MGKRRPDQATSRQPEPGQALPQNQRDVICAACAEFRPLRGNLLPLLHAVQEQLGFIPNAGIALIAHELNRSRAEVYGVVSFYDDFRTEPPSLHALRLCRAEACQALGARQLERHARSVLGLLPDAKRTEDGRLSLEPVYCLGNCALGPAMTINGRLCARVTPKRFDQLLGDLR